MTAIIMRVTIPGRLPTLNQMLAWHRQITRVIRKKGRKPLYLSRYDAEKKRHTTRLSVDFRRLRGLGRITGLCDYTFRHNRHDRRSDPNNVNAGAEKIIFDALQMAGIIENDGCKQINEIRHIPGYDRKKPEQIEVEVTRCQL